MTNQTVADFEYWLKYEAWTLDEAVSLILGLEPRVKPNHDRIIRTKKDTNNKQQIDRIRDLARRCLDTGSLKGSSESITPKDFVQWAKTKNLPIPEELDSLAGPISQPNCPYLDKDHQYFSTELQIAIETWSHLYEDGNYVSSQGHRNQIINYLTQHHNLTNTAKERIATLVNPNKAGGAPRTP